MLGGLVDVISVRGVIGVVSVVGDSQCNRCSQCSQCTLYRVFSLTWPACMQIYCNKRSVCIRKKFNSQKIGFGHQHGCCFIVWGHQYGRRDVM